MHPWTMRRVYQACDRRELTLYSHQSRFSLVNWHFEIDESIRHVDAPFGSEPTLTRYVLLELALLQWILPLFMELFEDGSA